MPSVPLGYLLTGAVIAAFLSIGSVVITPKLQPPLAEVSISPQAGTLTVGDTFTVNVEVESNVPTNVFSGLITFDRNILVVDSIDYNTSLADLWAVEPWYSNGEGTLNFAGGTTRPGGFVGKEKLLSATFRSVGEGEGVLSLSKTRVLRHDGLGTDATLGAPIDAVFTVSPEELAEKTVVTKTDSESGSVRVLAKDKSTDLNIDGKTTIADVSIFMLHLSSRNLRSDFNNDGKVGTKDLSILMNAI